MELRQENFDLLAERLLGPKGYFNTDDLRNVIRDGKEKWTDLENSVKQRLNHAIRGKRSVTKEALEEVRHKVRIKCDTSTLVVMNLILLNNLVIFIIYITNISVLGRTNFLFLFIRSILVLLTLLLYVAAHGTDKKWIEISKPNGKKGSLVESRHSCFLEQCLSAS
jgi:hypothetical protein